MDDQAFPGGKMKTWARTIIVLAVIFLAGFLAVIGVTAQDVCLIISPVAALAGVYIGLKGKGNADQ